MKRTLSFVALALSFSLGTVSTFADGGRRIRVSITNLTAHQIMSPAVVAAHNGHFEPMFTPGEPASEGLRQIAEDAVNGPMLERLENDRNVGDFAELGAVIPPGQTVSVELQARGRNRYVSLVGMLVTTNDAFYGVSGLSIPGRGASHAEAAAYDAGTEENNELCAAIPGPPCGNPLAMSGNGEGFVHVHRGIHGIGDLAADVWDWRNPVARVKIERVH